MYNSATSSSGSFFAGNFISARFQLDRFGDRLLQCLARPYGVVTRQRQPP